jgi:hypothetical protein
VKILVLKTGREPSVAAKEQRMAGQNLDGQRRLVGAMGPGVVEQLSENKRRTLIYYASMARDKAPRAAETAVASLFHRVDGTASFTVLSGFSDDLGRP